MKVKLVKELKVNGKLSNKRLNNWTLKWLKVLGQSQNYQKIYQVKLDIVLITHKMEL